jgi:hypothetical protein
MDNLNLNNYASTRESVRSMLGSALGADWRQALVARGFGWHFDVGAFSSPITGGGAGTIIDQDRPEFGISVPAGFACIPLRFDIAVQVPVQTTDAHETEILIAADRAAKWAGDGTVTTETPTGMRSDLSTGCPLQCFSAATANITNPTLGVELAHAVKLMNFGDATGLDMMELKLLYEPRISPIFIGPCAIYGYFGGSIASAGFANLDFIAIPSALVTVLS